MYILNSQSKLLYGYSKIYLIILVPGEIVGSENEPAVLGASDERDVADGQPALADHLIAQILLRRLALGCLRFSTAILVS